MKKILMLSLCGALFASVSHAASSQLGGVGVDVEPIIGFERVQKFLPEPHTKNRMMMGARLTAGIPLVAAEAEFTRGTDTESYPLLSMDSKDTDDKLKLGLRSSIAMGQLFSFQARAGGQAKRNTHVETLSGVSTTTVSPITYKPYAGLGISSHFMKGFQLTGALTVVFNDFPRMAGNEYQSTLGMSIRFP